MRLRRGGSQMDGLFLRMTVRDHRQMVVSFAETNIVRLLI